MEVVRSAASNVQDLPHVQSPRERWFRGGLRLPGAGDRQNVRVQEAGEEEDQETKG